MVSSTTMGGYSWGRTLFCVLGAPTCVVAVVVGCSTTAAPDVPPLPSTDCPGGCPSSLQCSRQSAAFANACVEKVSARSPVQQLPDGGVQACRYNGLGSEVRDRLVTEFKTEEFEISQEAERTAGRVVVKWSLPTLARSVTCAVFSCLPEFVEFDRGDGITGRSIANFDRCVLRYQDVSLPATQFDVSGGRQNAPPASFDPRADNPSDLGRQYVIDWLVVGCWATDGTQVVGASRLERVDPTAFSSFAPHVSDCTKDTDDGSACLLELRGRMGTCVARKCMPRCQEARECQRIVDPVSSVAAVGDGGIQDAGPDASDATSSAEGGAPDTKPCAFTCERLSQRADIGVCTPVPATNP